MSAAEHCIVCGIDLTSKDELYSWPGSEFRCHRCGIFTVLGTPEFIVRLQRLDSNARCLLSHKIRRAQSQSKSVLLVEDELDSWGLTEPLLRAAEQFDAIISWIANRTRAGQSCEVPTWELFAQICAPIDKDQAWANLVWLLNQQDTGKYIAATIGNIVRPRSEFAQIDLILTLSGWERERQIRSKSVETFDAFMAMKFGDAAVQEIFETAFIPAAQRAGFTLKLLTHDQPAGLIDDQLRVRIRTSRFVVADLTHDNNGAYWEAGFAEGLEKPVIYTCERSKWNDLKTGGKTHFDTNHLVTIIWELTNKKKTEDQLAATIRATFQISPK